MFCVNQVRSLLGAGAAPGVVEGRRGDTALIAAAQEGHHNVVRARLHLNFTLS